MITDMNVQNHLRSIGGGGLPGSDPLADMGGVGGLPSIQGPVGGNSGSGAEFGEMLINEIEKVNTEMIKSDQMAQALATGQSQDVHGTLIQMKKAELQFQMLVQVRNKMMKAYEEVMRMQA